MRTNEDLFFAIPLEMRYFIAILTSSTLKFSSVKIWDSANSCHICHDSLAFNSFKPLTNQALITGLRESMSAEKEGKVYRICKRVDGNPYILFLNKS